MISVCLPSDALSQHYHLSYLGFSYLGRGVSLHSCPSKAQPLLLTLDKGYLLSVTAPDLDSVIYVYLCSAVHSCSVVLFIDPESLESRQGICFSIHFQLAWRLELESYKGSVCSFERTRDQIANICWIIKNQDSSPKKHLFLLYWLCQSLWLCGSQ